MEMDRSWQRQHTYSLSTPSHTPPLIVFSCALAVGAVVVIAQTHVVRYYPVFERCLKMMKPLIDEQCRPPPEAARAIRGMGQWEGEDRMMGG